MYDTHDLIKGFRYTGIQTGDLVMVHSSFKSLGDVEGGADSVIDALADLVSPNGTLFFPTYTVASWCGGHYFDIAETPSEMGIITEIARLRPHAIRTRHPSHSFAILGEWHERFDFRNVESFGVDSPYATFHDWDGLIMSIGVPSFDDTFSFVHYVERCANAHYRRIKNFSGIYVGWDGIPELQTYQMSVRHTLRHITHVEPAYEKLLMTGVVRQCQVAGATVSYFRAQEYFDAVYQMVQDEPDLFFYYKGAEHVRPLRREPLDHHQERQAS